MSKGRAPRHLAARDRKPDLGSRFQAKISARDFFTGTEHAPRSSTADAAGGRKSPVLLPGSRGSPGW